MKKKFLSMSAVFALLITGCAQAATEQGHVTDSVEATASVSDTQQQAPADNTAQPLSDSVLESQDIKKIVLHSYESFEIGRASCRERV